MLPLFGLVTFFRVAVRFKRPGRMSSTKTIANAQVNFYNNSSTKPLSNVFKSLVQ